MASENCQNPGCSKVIPQASLRKLGCGHIVCDQCLRYYLPYKLKNDVLGCAVPACSLPMRSDLLSLADYKDLLSEDHFTAMCNRADYAASFDCMRQLQNEEYTTYHASAIIPGVLYLGSEADALHLEYLWELNIKKIINMAVQSKNYYPKNFEYEHVPISDSPDVSFPFPRCVASIACAIREKKPVLVHCLEGRSRSATAVLAYLISTGLTLQKALGLVRGKRNIIAPNPGFLEQLQAFERMCVEMKVVSL